MASIFFRFINYSESAPAAALLEQGQLDPHPGWCLCYRTRLRTKEGRWRATKTTTTSVFFFHFTYIFFHSLSTRFTLATIFHHMASPSPPPPWSASCDSLPSPCVFLTQPGPSLKWPGHTTQGGELEQFHCLRGGFFPNGHTANLQFLKK